MTIRKIAEQLKSRIVSCRLDVNSFQLWLHIPPCLVPSPIEIWEFYDLAQDGCILWKCPN